MLNLFLLLIILIAALYLIRAITQLKQRVKTLETKLGIQPQPAPMPRFKIRTVNKSQTFSTEQTSFVSKYNISERIRIFLTTRNVIALVGGLLLLFGCGFLVKYAAQYALISIQSRLVFSSLIGLVALILGVALRKKQEAIALVLQGLGLGIIYLTVFASFEIYGLINLATAFAILIGTAAVGVFLSTWQNAKYLALLSFLGGFVAPLLLTTSQPNITDLFTYYLILNVGVFITAWFKQWRELNYLGFIATFAVTGLWSYQNYTPEYFAITETFLCLFFAMYLIIAIVFSYKQTHSTKRIIDTTLTFALPLLFFLYQTKLLHYHAVHLAITAFALAGFYALIAYILHTIKTPNRPILFAMTACAIIFFTAAIPLALQNHWTGITWALEGAALFYYGQWRRENWPTIAGMILQGAASIAFIHYFTKQYDALYLFNGTFLGALILILSALFSSYIARHKLKLSVPFFILGALWFIFIGIYQNGIYFNYHTISSSFTWLLSHKKTWQIMYGSLLFFASGALIAASVNRLVKFNLLQIFIYVGIAGLLLVETSNALSAHVFKFYLPEPYLISFLFCYSALYLFKNDLSQGAGFKLAALLWLAMLIQIALWIGRFNYFIIPNEITLQYCLYGAALALYYLVFECSYALKFFPLSYQSDIYARYTPIYLIGVFIAWFIASTFKATLPVAHIIYLPLFNPLDLTTALILFAIFYWRRAHQTWLNAHYAHSLRVSMIGLYSVGFVWVNAILLRSLHHWAHVPLTATGIMHSPIAQISLSILWASIALALMISASIKLMRTPWLVGASLIGVTVVKILLVDLSNQNTLTRIVSFMSVGILLLIIGYFASLPPKK